MDQQSQTIWRPVTLPHDEIVRRVNGREWHHAFEIAPGVTTPGGSPIDPRRTVSAYGVPENLSGMHALDIGTWDGPYAFELERRGATVTAIDIQDPELTGFNTAKDILGSNVTYKRASVYDLPNVVAEGFDLVFYPGVYYHLKHPILALEAIAKVMKLGGRLCFIGECIISYAERLGGARDKSLNLKKISKSDVPITLCYPGVYKGVSNWFIPNLACFRSWLQAAGFRLDKYSFYHEPKAAPFPHQRLWGVATKAGEPIDEHPLVGVNFWVAGASIQDDASHPCAIKIPDHWADVRPTSRT